MEITSPSPSKTDHAIQDLIDSCRVQVPDGSNGQSQSLRYLDVKHACDELLSFTFHSEDGKLQLIERLTKLEGNFVVKIIRKGLSGLSKVYSEARSFEEESLKLVELCCSQSEALKIGCEDGRHVASPASIIGWMVELCEELMEVKEASGSKPTVLMSVCLSEIRNIYEIIVCARLEIDSGITPTPVALKTFKSVFEVLIQRINFEGFEELLKETLEILKAEERSESKVLLDGKSCTRNAPILRKWVSILKYSFDFITNLFAVKLAKQDLTLDNELQIDVVIAVLDELGADNIIGAGKVIGFFSNLPKHLQGTLTDWIPVMKALINALPETWDLQVYDIINAFVDKFQISQVNANPILEDFTAKKIEDLKTFLLQLKDLDKTEEVKTKVFQIGIGLYDDLPCAKDFNLALDVVFYLAKDMDIDHIRQYAIELTRAARNKWKESDYQRILDVIRLIVKSTAGIESKNELLECHIRIVQDNCNTMHDILFWCKGTLAYCKNEEIWKRFFMHAAAGRIQFCESLFITIISGSDLVPDKTITDNHIILLFNIIDEAIKSGSDTFFKDTNTKKHKCLFVNSMDFVLIFASLAGAMAVGTFDSNVNVIALVLLGVIKEPRLRRPIDILALYIELNEIIRAAKFAIGQESIMNKFVMGLILISKLPLTIPQMSRQMRTITKILNDEKLTDEQISNVMGHLYKMPDKFLTSSVDSSALASHFDKLVQPPIVRKLCHIVVRKKEPNSFLTVMELLCENMPNAFVEGTSVVLFRRVVEDCNLNGYRAALIISLEMIKQYISDDEFEIDIDEIVKTYSSTKILASTTVESLTEMLSSSQLRMLLFAECLTECCKNNFNDKRKIIIFIRQIKDLLEHHNCSSDDLLKMTDYRLQIPKHLVVTFRDALNLKEARIGIRRVLEVVKELEPSILSRSEPPLEEKDFFFQHDFHMLLKQDSSASADVCSILQLYKTPYISALLASLSKDKERLQDDTEWSPMYDHTQLLTPARIVDVTVHHLKKLGLRDKKDVTQTCSKLFENYNAPNTCKCPPLQNGFQTYFALFVNIMDRSSHHSEIQPWWSLCAHYTVQCHDVILAACSWKKGTKDVEEACKMNNNVVKVISSLLRGRGTCAAKDHLCYDELTNELDLMRRIIATDEDMEFTGKLFELLQINSQSTAACLDVITLWCKEESMLLVNSIKGLYQEEDLTINPEKLDEETKASLKILPYAAKVFPNSAGKLQYFLEEMVEKCRKNDALNLKRIPEWRNKMIDAGYPMRVIDSWCTSLVHFQNLSSRDIDAIANMTPDAINFLSQETKDIAKYLFSEDAPKTWETGNKSLYQENNKSFKLRLRLAKIIYELRVIAIHLKEDSIVEKIKDGVIELCAICSDGTTCNLYKVQGDILRKLFDIFFDDKRGLGEECVSQLKYQKMLQERFVTMFRRLARCINARPTLLGHIKMIVDKFQSYYDENRQDDQQIYQEVQNAIHESLLRLEANQDAIHTLQAAGYNQNTSTREDLWYSRSIQMSAYVNKTGDSQEQIKTNLTKIQMIWVNQLLESVNTCSDKIPGCYAPNGFFSEKPVICGINIDNRIISLYEGNMEMANVEVKLFPAGMFVFRLHRNSHPYDTGQAWAAFYKMLLDKHLVPKIFITNISPAFDWIKQFVETETAPPCNISFLSCCGLIPLSEDKFDYDPDIEIRRLNTELANSDMKEIIILNQDKAQKLEFRDLKAPIANRKSVITEQMGEVESHLKQESRLQEMHPELKDREEIIKRLKTPIRKAVEISVDGGEPTEESISRSIDMRRLLSGMHSQDAQQQYRKDDYSAIILVAVKTVTEDLRGNRNSYDGCEHVVF